MLDDEQASMAEDDTSMGPVWTPDEDEALRLAVEKFGELDWESIAAEVERRNREQCRHRWNKVLKPVLAKWSHDEDEILKENVLHGEYSWEEISARLSGRTAKECRSRWQNYLDPSTSKAPFTQEEDTTIQEAYERLGSHWNEIAELLSRRTEESVKARWSVLSRNRSREANTKPTLTPDTLASNGGTSSDEDVVFHPPPAEDTYGPGGIDAIGDNMSPSCEDDATNGRLPTSNSISGGMPPPMSSGGSVSAPEEDGAYDIVWREGDLGLKLKPGYGDVPVLSKLTGKGTASGLQNANVGDELVSVNGVLVDGQAYHDTVRMLKHSVKPTVLRFRPGRDRRASGMSITSISSTRSTPSTTTEHMRARSRNVPIYDTGRVPPPSSGPEHSTSSNMSRSPSGESLKKKRIPLVLAKELVAASQGVDVESAMFAGIPIVSIHEGTNEAHLLRVEAKNQVDKRVSMVDHTHPEEDSEDSDSLLDIPYNVGFLSVSAEDTYGSSNLWIDPELLGLRLDATEVTIPHTQNNTTQWDNKNTTKVYAATYRGESVAVKRLTEVGRTLENAAALATLCKTLHDLTHPNIIPIIGLSWSKALDIQVITPLATRGDLRSLLDSSDAASLTWEDFKCQVSIDVVSARACLHRQNFSAGLGGLASWNVLLDGPDGTAKLNLVRLECRGLSDAHVRVPSPLRWVAPEVVLGGPQSSSADMYALGVLLTELDTTQLPFHDAVSPNGTAMDDMLIAMRVAKGDLRPTLSPTCPDVIAELVDKCLSAEPTQRPRADQVMYQLRAVLKEL